MKTRLITGLLACGILAGITQGATIRYRQSGDWSATAPANTGPGWQNVSEVPGINDTGRINWGGNTVTVTTAVPTIGQVQIGVDESGTLVVANGGVLTTDNAGSENGRVVVGNNNAAATGTMTVAAGGTVDVGDILYTGLGTTGTTNISGTVNVGSHLWAGWNAGITGTINVHDGGMLNVAGMMGLNWNDNGAIGLLYVNDGGTVNLSQIHSSGNSIRGDSLLTIAGTGMLTKTGNFVTVIEEQYIDTGKIVGAGGASLIVSYDAELDLTTVVIPEPGSLILLGIAGFGVLARRGRRSVG
ncbi:MAG TPA: PEP-CTERM sorting domain-containing protein [Luteolibacter sp.]|nr:PEP-CTERM sorting domain-containing protein [Luteolibacter sp.]